MPKVTPIRARRAERKRAEILRAGLKVFAEKGFATATMDDIAVELEATKGLVYYHFETKEELLREILEKNELTAGFESILDGIGDRPLRELGRGAMGVVYQARQNTTNRMVALKLIVPESAATRTASMPSGIAMVT